MFKELPVRIYENEVTKALNYLILTFTAYKKIAAEVIFDRLIHVTIVCLLINYWHFKNLRSLTGVIKQFSHLSEVLLIFS